MLAEHAVGENAAEQRREVDEPGIETVDVRGERLHAERPEHRFVQLLERAEPDHVFGVLGLQQVLHHVEDEQRAHSVVGESLPHLGRKQEAQPARMAEQVIGTGRHAGLLCGCHRNSLGSRG